MSSKLPIPKKIGALKPVNDAIIPTSRMAQNMNLFIKGTTNMPLTDNSNIRRGKRVASPDLQSNFASRTHLRRSKSVSDLNRPPQSSSLKRQATAFINPNPQKIAKTNFTATINAARSKPQPPSTKPIATNRPTKPIVTAARKAISTATTNRKPAANGPSSSSASSSSSSSKTGAPPAKKKIPPYDMKARYYDQKEKNDALKEKCQLLESKFGELKDLPEKYDAAVKDINEKSQEISTLKTINDEINKKNVEHERSLKSLSKTLCETTTILQSTKEELIIRTEEYERIKEKYEKVDIKVNQLTTENENMKSELNYLNEEVFKSNILRKELHNQVMDLRGNIRVFCRVRPPLQTEEDRLSCNWSYLDESSLEVSSIEELPSGARNKSSKYEFNFDQIFNHNSMQEDIFECVSPLIQSALDGYNVCIFAYGQTGSGKTYTMDGTSNDIGIIPRTVDLLFDCVENYKRQGWVYEIKVTFLEIYNEILYDLLSNETKEMEIRMVSAKQPHEIYVSNITEVVVSCPNQLRELMSKAKSNRATASTVGNERSSRSHAVTRLQLQGYHNQKNELSVGTINLVDLAGSESPKNSVRMDETKKINKSLSELTNVIMALVQKQDHVPYRNSKLTHLLMPCLGGNSKTLMFVNASPFQDCFTETTKSLRFAATVNSCKMNKTKKNIKCI